MSLRIVFMGTPEFSVPTLLEIVGQGHEVVACYSQPPRPAGRGMELKKSPVHEAAESFGIPVYTPLSLKDAEAQKIFTEHDADVAVVVAYGLLLPKAILDAPRNGCLNLHASILPRWRGAAPINRAIMAGDTETAIQVMQMEEGLDTGPVCMSEPVAIPANMTAGELHDQLSALGGDVIRRALAALTWGDLKGVPQPEDGVTYAAKLSKNETRIDWQKTAGETHNFIRGLSPFPGAWCEMSFGGKVERVKVLRSQLAEASGVAGEILALEGAGPVIGCGEGSVRLVQLQRAGKKPVTGEEFLRGAKLDLGDKLS